MLQQFKKHAPDVIGDHGPTLPEAEGTSMLPSHQSICAHLDDEQLIFVYIIINKYIQIILLLKLQCY